MVVRDTKIQLYEQMIYEAELQSSEAIIEKLHSENESKIAGKTAELLNWKEEVVKRRESTANLRKQEIISEQRQKNMEMTLRCREEIVEDFVVRMKEKAVDHTKSMQYRNDLCEEIQKLLKEVDETAVILQVRSEDIDFVRKSVDGLGKEITYETLPADRIGGFIMQNLRRSYAIEDTIASKIDRNRYEIVRMLYREFEKMDGESNE